MTMRVLACLVHQDGVASAQDSSANDQMQAMKAVADIAAQQQKGAEMLNLKIEQRMRIELLNLGLIERADLEYDLEHVREDDVICHQLRLNQEALRKHVKERDQAQTGSRKRLRACIEAGFQREKLLADVLAAAKAVTDSIPGPKFKWAKGTKPQDMKKHLETWDRAYNKFKAYLANPTKRKPILSGSSSGKKVMGEGKVSKSGAPGGARSAGGGMWAGTSGGSSANAKAMAVFHQNVHRK